MCNAKLRSYVTRMCTKKIENIWMMLFSRLTKVTFMLTNGAHYSEHLSNKIYCFDRVVSMVFI